MTTKTTIDDYTTPEFLATWTLKLIREAVLIKGEIETLKGMLAEAEARSAQLDQAVIDLGVTDCVNSYKAHINNK